MRHLRGRESKARPSADGSFQLRGVTGGYGRTDVIWGVDVDVRRGQIDALIGPNGAGKTTLLRLAAGLLKPTAGSVHFDGRDITDVSPHGRARAGICLIPEGRGVFPSLTVRENFLLQEIGSSETNPIARALEAFPALAPHLKRTAGTLSGGEQQMVAMARCYLASPSIVLLDEVSLGLAPKIVDQIFDSMIRLASEGISLVIVEQYVNRVLDIAETVHIVKQGRVSFSGSAKTLDRAAVMGDYLGQSIAESGSGPGPL